MSRYFNAMLLGAIAALVYTWFSASREAMEWSCWNLIDSQLESHRRQVHASLLNWNAGIRDQKPLPPLGPRLSHEERQALVDRGYLLLVQKRLLEDGLKNVLVTAFLCAAWVRFTQSREGSESDKS
jgi:hypothetical protein